MNDIVNAQITDAVTQTNVKVLGEGPAQAVAMALQSHSHATGLAMENASLVQGNMQQVVNTSTSKLVALITAQAG
ncbi:RebB family R body protein [Thalassospira lucentensis]|uniref:RebB family R body protein n=1 Tax=Thalassospira lucentensis TaxID=168935 RepID=UPI00142E4806|nr:RebB family R body protein [Thalassospira lucentensis]NIZ03279.1 RebB like protein [Thalassospira lucentensis]